MTTKKGVGEGIADSNPIDLEGEQPGTAVDIVSGLVLIAFCLFALLWLIPAEVTGKSSGSDVSPAFFPRLSIVVILFLSLGLVAHRLYTAGRDATWDRGRLALGETAATLGFALFVGILLPLIGFWPTSAVVIVVGGMIARYQKWWPLILLAVLFPLIVKYGAWAIFTVDIF